MPIEAKHKCDAKCRHCCWSITINNPTEIETRVDIPGWKMKGQYEVGESGTRHFQGMLTTPQSRFAAIKKAFPKAHIEVARNEAALELYVTKEDTRVDVYTPGAIPTIFQYQSDVAAQWNENEWNKFSRGVKEDKVDDMAMLYLDILVTRDIIAGKRGVEWIAINPMWRSSWKKFWRSIIKRDGSQSHEVQERSQGDHSQSAGGEGSASQGDNSLDQESIES